MAEPLDPERPRPATPAYLPRLWKAAPEPVEVEDDVPAKKKKDKRSKGEPEVVAKANKPKSKPKKKKLAEDAGDDGTGAVKLEETPVLDTYEARQRARWIIGGVLGSIGLVGLILALRAFRGSGAEEIREGEPPEPQVAQKSQPNAEEAARAILDNAKRADKQGKTKVALDQLNRIIKNYQGTAAAREATLAVARDLQKQPLFAADAPEQANGPKPPPPGISVATGPAPPKAAGTGAVSPAQPPAPVGPGSPSAPATPNPVAAVPVKSLPSGYREKFDAPIHPSGWPTRIVADRDGAEMVLVPAGTFIMGREDGEPAERPAHRVSVSTFYIDRHEVTVRQYAQFLKETGRPLDGARLGPRETPDPPPTDQHPVVNVSAREAKAYCNWAKRQLPTEAQWELAARSPEGRISYWNGELPRKDPPKGTRVMEPVMSLPSDFSAFGAFDMGANAWEWTSEYYDSQYYQQFRNLVLDPTGPKESRAKIVQVTVKGGSKSGILTWRDGLKIETRLPYLGFRGALAVEGAPAAPPVAPAPTNTPALPGGVQPF